jgi:hypothetical protein
MISFNDTLISFDNYKKSLQKLDNRNANSWIGFEEKEIRFHSLCQKVLVPYIYDKPPLFVRIIYWIFDCLTCERHSSRTAKKLITCLKMSTRAFKESNIDLQLQALQISETFMKKLTRDPDNQTRKLREIQEIRTQLIKDQHLAYTLKEYTLGPKNNEVAYSMDWSKDDPILFDPTYLIDLSSQMQRHPDMQSPLIPSETKTKFITFISDLMEDNTIVDHYNVPLSKDNTDQIRKMMLAIMNQVNAKRLEPGFQEFYATIIDTICLSIDNCSNRINTQIESVFVDLNYPKEGTLGLRIFLALQELRMQIFRKGVHLHVAENSYYLRHEAASVSYYFRRMTELGLVSAIFGLAPSVSSMDHNFESYAMKNLEESIVNFFQREYTPFTIFQKLSEAIQDPNDTSIPCQLFTKWVQSRYSDEEQESLIDEMGKYRPECFLRLFTELQIFERV